ncbi:hypothetical protein VNO77_29888 [Canavalia gladiata]|uniref:Uncharacterized protein n=1 Tax=Canavalia gladiata TaxID=3824 RepID=A0AAN9KNC4_CANGL
MVSQSGILNKLTSLQTFHHLTRDASADVSSAAADFQQEEQSSQDNRTIAVCPTLTQSSKTSAVCDSLSEHLDFDARCFVNRGDEQRGFGFLRETVDDLFSSSWKEHERHILPERHQDNHTRPSVPEPSSRRQEPVNSTTSGAFVPQDKFAQSSAPQQHSANPRGYGTLPQNQPYYTRVINPQEAFPGSGAYGYHPFSAGMNYYYVPLNWNEFTPLHTWPPADSASSGYHFYGNFGFPIYNPQGCILSLDYGAGPTSMFRPYVFLRQPQHTIPLCSQRPLDFQNVSSNKPSRHWPRKR